LGFTSYPTAFLKTEKGRLRRRRKKGLMTNVSAGHVPVWGGGGWGGKSEGKTPQGARPLVSVRCCEKEGQQNGKIRRDWELKKKSGGCNRGTVLTSSQSKKSPSDPDLALGKNKEKGQTRQSFPFKSTKRGLHQFQVAPP